MLDEEISKMTIDVTQAGHTNLLIKAQGLAMSTLVLEQVVTLLSWLRPHQQRNVPYTAANNGITDTKALERCPQPELARKLKSRTWGATTCLAVESTVSALQAGPASHQDRGCATMWEGWEVTIDIIIHDKKFELR